MSLAWCSLGPFDPEGAAVDYDEIDSLRRRSPAWRLLRADNAPLVLSFLGQVFVEENARSLPGSELISRLDDELFVLSERLGPDAYPKPAKAYLDDWASPEAGWLRKYYPEGSNEPHFDATVAVEKSLSWIASIQERSFVGTESRLNIVFELLRQLAFGAETDPDVRLAELQRRRALIDEEIAQVSAGHVEVMNATAQRDRYQQFSETARGLLADFREVEGNFRLLDRELREQIATWSGSKGELLDEVLGSRTSIADSDQGKSFHAFYDFLLSADRQTEFTDLLDRVQSLEDIEEIDPRMGHIHYDWLDAGERTQATVRVLSEQLRRFLDDQVWLENRRVMDILRSIESSALRLRGQPDVPVCCEVDETSPTVMLPMERPLYTPQSKQALDSAGIAIGEEGLDTSVLFEQIHVDPARLARQVQLALQRRSQLDLGELVAQRPLEQGLAELVTYLSLTDPAFTVVFDEQQTEQVQWTDSDRRSRVATLPRVTFVRTAQAMIAVEPR